MEIKELVKITAGKMHAWYKTTEGFLVRKPLGKVDLNIAGKELFKKAILWLGWVLALLQFALDNFPL